LDRRLGGAINLHKTIVMEKLAQQRALNMRKPFSQKRRDMKTKQQPDDNTQVFFCLDTTVDHRQ